MYIALCILLMQSRGV